MAIQNPRPLKTLPSTAQVIIPAAASGSGHSQGMVSPPAASAQPSK